MGSVWYFWASMCSTGLSSILNLSGCASNVSLSVIKFSNRALYIVIVRRVILCPLQCAHGIIYRRECGSQLSFCRHYGGPFFFDPVANGLWAIATAFYFF